MAEALLEPADLGWLDDFRLFAEDVLRECGTIALEYYSYQLEADDKEGSPVTIADRKINALIIARLQAKHPHLPILGEEQSAAGSSKHFLVVSDPLDGTIPYLLNIPISTCNLALLKDGQPLVGVVYDFHRNRLYSAVKGQGAYLNGQLMAKTPGGLPQMKLVCVERWPAAPHDVGVIQARLAEAGYQTPNYASFGYTAMMVALGKIAGGVYAGDRPWDVAAPKVIVEELGVRVTDLQGRQQRYDGPINGAIVAYPETHRFLVQ